MTSENNGTDQHEPEFEEDPVEYEEDVTDDVDPVEPEPPKPAPAQLKKPAALAAAIPAEDELERQAAAQTPQLARNELEVLKARARMLGITFSNNIGIEALRQKVNAKMEGENAQANDPEEVDEPNPLEDEAPAEVKKPKLTLRQKIWKEQMKLVRLRITNLDPKKKDLPGEILCVANEYIGTVRKFIPFGEVTEDGYHVPYILYTLLKQREFLNIRIVKDRRSQQTRVESNYVKEFALEVLPPLTKTELERLATAQKAAGSVDGPTR